MKIVQINAVGQTSSTGRNCKEIAEYINTFTNHICYTAFAQGKKDMYCYQIGNKIEWKIHALLSRIFGKQGYYSYIGTKKFLKYLDTIGPDIIHLNNLHGNYINMPLLFEYIKKNQIATVVTLHDCWFYTGKCTHYSLSKCYKWKNGCHDCEKLKEDNNSWFFDRTSIMWKDKQCYFNEINNLAVIGVSRWITNEAKQSLFKNAKIITSIYNWIDLDIFKVMDVKKLKKEINLKNDFTILGVASEWSNKKGLDIFLKLAEKMENYNFIIVGKLPNIKIPSNVYHINMTNNVNELVQYYNIADCFLQLSKEESFGKVVAESLACGTPVITSTMTANPELINRNCGYVCDDFNEIIKCVEAIKKNGKEMYSRDCRLFAKKHFNMVDRINDYIKVYNKLINKQGMENMQ